MKAALKLQNQYTKEVEGFVTAEGTVILLPMQGSTANHSIIKWPVTSADGTQKILYPVEENGVWKLKINHYDNTGSYMSQDAYTISYDFHTHPFSGTMNEVSSDDKILAGQYSTSNASMLMKIVNQNYIVDFDKNGATGAYESNNCR